MARSKSTATEMTKKTEAGDMHTARRDENKAGSEGFDSAEVGKKLVGSVDMKNGTLQKYTPNKLNENHKAPAAARQPGGSHLGNTNDSDYLMKSKGNFEGKRGHNQSDADSSAHAQPKTNLGGVMGNTKNVPRDPSDKGHNTTLGFGGKIGDGLAGARKGANSLEKRPGPDTAKGVGAATEGGILGNTKDVRRDPKGKNMTEGFAGSGTVGNGFV